MKRPIRLPFSLGISVLALLVKLKRFFLILFSSKYSMPAQNPKHKKKQVQTLREQQYGGRKIPFRPILMVVIFVGVVFMIIFVIEYYQKIAPPIGEVIQDGDVVTLDYKLWADTSHTGNIATWYDGGNAAPINNATAWNTTVSNSSLIAGFYRELLGKSVGFSTIFTRASESSIYRSEFAIV